MSIKNALASVAVKDLGSAAERAGYGSFTLAVRSLDEQMADLEKCGLDAGRQMIGVKVRVVMIQDQDGNSIAFTEPVEQSVER